MRITSWNFLHGMTIPPSSLPPEPGVLANAITDLGSDVMALQEVDYLQDRSNKENQVANIASLLGAKYWAFAPSLTGATESSWSKKIAEDQKLVTNASVTGSAGYGIGLISKIPVTSWHRLELRGSPFGLLLFLPIDGKLKRTYIRDHPRSAIAAVLENGWLIVNTHLSFIPIVNSFQLSKIKRWIKRLPVKDKSKIILLGDFNMLGGLPARTPFWNSLAKMKTFPSWSPKTQLDYILSQSVASEDVIHHQTQHCGLSDHLPITVEINTSLIV
ncbi:MAG: hypothetical protein F2570_03565 [Actinobacteria bacterium]|nr:hypothetical protein [Actinomycetota bacterium]